MNSVGTRIRKPSLRKEIANSIHQERQLSGDNFLRWGPPLWWAPWEVERFPAQSTRLFPLFYTVYFSLEISISGAFHSGGNICCNFKQIYYLIIQRGNVKTHKKKDFKNKSLALDKDPQSVYSRYSFDL